MMSPRIAKGTAVLVLALALAPALAGCMGAPAVRSVTCKSALKFHSASYSGLNLFFPARRGRRIGEGIFPPCGVNGAVPVAVAAIGDVDPSAAVGVISPKDGLQVFLRKGAALPRTLKSMGGARIETATGGFATPDWRHIAPEASLDP